MTEKASKIFNQVLDLNWDMSQAIDHEKKWNLSVKVGEKLKELKAEMGEEAYETFMSNGKKMFAPKQ